MNHNGDAAESVVRMTMEGVEIAAKIVGAGAKNLAVFLYAALKNKSNATVKGRARLSWMLKSGNELKIFGVRESDLKKFSAEAKRYGVLYCVLRNRKGSPDGLCDVMVRTEDAGRMDRIVQRFNFVDKTTIKSDIERSKAERQEKKHGRPEKSKEDQLLDEMLEPPKKEKSAPENPQAAKTAKTRPSKPSSTRSAASVRGSSTTLERPSVRGELRAIAAVQKKETEARRQTERTKKRSPKSKQQERVRNRKKTRKRER